MNTSIDLLLSKFEEVKIQPENTIEDRNPQDIIFDFSLSQDNRIEALNQYFTTNPEDILEIVKKLNVIYCMSPIGLMRRFILEVAEYSNLPANIRIDCAITLADIKVSEKLGLECLKKLIPLFYELPTPCRVDYLLKLVNNNFTECIDNLYDFATTEFSTSAEYRYKTILSFEKTIQENGFTIMIKACSKFICQNENDITFRILACQNVLSKREESDIDAVKIAEETLLDFMTNSNLQHNHRADSADVILHYGTEKLVLQAEQILLDLGGRNSVSIYDNKENVHTESVESSVLETIQYLDTLNLHPIPTFETVSYNIQKITKELYRPMITTSENRESKFQKDGNIVYVPICMRKKYFVEDITENEEKVKSALLRIELDRTVFKTVNHTLQSVLLHMYVYIQSHDCRDELQKRLVEELIDMSGTCSSGYISRLVNVLSGFGKHSLHISWEDQIIANLAGRLNARMKTDDDMENILEQMVNPDIADRSAFLKFFRENISFIKEEMYQEFREHMEDTDWDLYFRRAIMNYEK